MNFLDFCNYPTFENICNLFYLLFIKPRLVITGLLFKMAKKTNKTAVVTTVLVGSGEWIRTTDLRVISHLAGCSESTRRGVSKKPESVPLVRPCTKCMVS